MNGMTKFAIAVDGPAGSGKSTLAKAIAKKLGIIYVDTGAMYRALAYFCMEQGVDTLKEAEVMPLLEKINLRIEPGKGLQKIFLNGTDVTDRIRTQAIGQGASNVGTIQGVREKLGQLQRDMAEEYSVIMDGRDIGTKVLPDAAVKIYLDASVEERTRRRMGELTEKGESPVFDVVKEEIIKRDNADMTREHHPLYQAADAILVDSTAMNSEEAVAYVLQVIAEKIQSKNNKADEVGI